jgi:hypothetical protein
MSWKQHGGTNKSGLNATYDNLVTNNLSVKNAYNGNFNVCGTIFADRIIASVSESEFGNNVLVAGNAVIGGNITGSSLTISSGSSLFGKTFFGQTQYILGKSTGITINSSEQDTANATIDISGSRPESINVFTQSQTSRNTLVQNVSGNGIVLLSDIDKTSVELYHGTNVSNVTGSAHMTFTGDTNTLGITAPHISTEGPVEMFHGTTTTTTEIPTLVVHDASGNTTTYLSRQLGENIIHGTVTAFRGVSTNSVAFVETSNISGTQSWKYGGGSISGKSMGTMGYTSSSTENVGMFVPSITMTEGNSTSSARAIVGINTPFPSYNGTVLNVNGTTHIRQVEIIPTNVVPGVLFDPNGVIPLNIFAGSFSISGQNGILTGPYEQLSPSSNRYFAYKTDNGGKSWTKTILVGSSSLEVKVDCHFCDNSNTNIFAYSTNNFYYLSKDNGTSWFAYNPFTTTADNTTRPSIYTYSTYAFFGYRNELSYTANYAGGTPHTIVTVSANFMITSIHGYDSRRVYIAGHDTVSREEKVLYGFATMTIPL